MLHMVYNSDDNYLLPTFVSAASALYHSADPSKIIIDVLDCGIDNQHWQELHGRLKVRFPSCAAVQRIPVDESRISKYRSWRGSVATYARILTPELLQDVDMCLFVDGDTLFVSDPLELQNYYDSNYWIQGSVDYHDGDDRFKLYEKYGLEWPDVYVCCGLMLMNLKKLRENAFVEKCFSFLDKYPVLTSVDQEAINSIAHGHVATLPSDWGVFSCMGYDEVSRPKCWHYVFGKPWSLGTAWTRCLYEMDQAWFVYARKCMGLTFRQFGKRAWLVYMKRRMTTLAVSLARCMNHKWRNRYFYKGNPLRLLTGLFPYYGLDENKGA